MNKTLVAAIIILIVLGGAYWYRNSFAVLESEPRLDITTETDEDDQVVVGQETPDNDAAAASGDEIELILTGSNFKFSESEIRVKEGDTVKVNFINSVGTHDFVLSDYNVRTKVLQTGQQETISFVANKKGTFEYYCSVGSHRAMGMKGILIVE